MRSRRFGNAITGWKLRNEKKTWKYESRKNYWVRSICNAARTQFDFWFQCMILKLSLLIFLCLFHNKIEFSNVCAWIFWYCSIGFMSFPAIQIIFIIRLHFDTIFLINIYNKILCILFFRHKIRSKYKKVVRHLLQTDSSEFQYNSLRSAHKERCSLYFLVSPIPRRLWCNSPRTYICNAARPPLTLGCILAGTAGATGFALITRAFK